MQYHRVIKHQKANENNLYRQKLSDGISVLRFCNMHGWTCTDLLSLATRHLEMSVFARESLSGATMAANEIYRVDIINSSDAQN